MSIKIELDYQSKIVHSCGIKTELTQTMYIFKLAVGIRQKLDIH